MLCHSEKKTHVTNIARYETRTYTHYYAKSVSIGLSDPTRITIRVNTLPNIVQYIDYLRIKPKVWRKKIDAFEMWVLQKSAAYLLGREAKHSPGLSPGQGSNLGATDCVSRSEKPRIPRNAQIF